MDIKQDYPEFHEWFDKISRQRRECFITYRENGTIGALMIYKLEEEPLDVTPPLPAKVRVKLSTLKVAVTGYKIGELLIKLAVDFSIRNNATEIYLTHFLKKDDRLFELICQFGFTKIGKNIRGEEVYLKKLVPDSVEITSISPLDISRIYYPSFYDGAAVSKFIVPIKPEYHSRLFTDYPNRQTCLRSTMEDLWSRAIPSKRHILVTHLREGWSLEMSFYFTGPVIQRQLRLLE